MIYNRNKKLITINELLFQIVLHFVVFIFYSFDKDHPHIDWFEIVFFSHYSICTLFISYYLLPNYLYKKQHLQFFIFLSLTLCWVILVEELMLEQIFFPHMRAKAFPGVFFTLFQILPVITILSGFKFAWDALGKQRELDKLKKSIQESELQMLKSQINPHFLFNNLNNLYAYAIENSPKTPKIILDLSGVLRYMLYECKENYVPLSKEIEQLENFIKLNQLQIEERGFVGFEYKNIQSNYLIAPLILIVFIENAFKHSQANLSENIYT
ncbi:MAG: histidine kinase [Thalassobius sp.]|nr:histidine kinase [Thalassovita sp.]